MPDVVARVLVEAGHEVFLLRSVLPKKSIDSAVLDYATANALVVITCNRDDFIPLASSRTYSGPAQQTSAVYHEFRSDSSAHFSSVIPSEVEESLKL